MDTCNLSNNPHHKHLLQKTAELAIQSIIVPDLTALHGGVLGYAHNYRQVVHAAPFAKSHVARKEFGHVRLPSIFI